MAKRGARAVGDEADFAWPPPDDELSGYDADPPTEPIDLDALPIRRTGLPVAVVPPTPPTLPILPTLPLPSAESPAPPEGLAGELEWPPTSEAMASMAVIAVETGREHVLDPTTGSLVVVPRSRDAAMRGAACAPPVMLPDAGQDASSRTTASREPASGVHLPAGSVPGATPASGSAPATAAPRRAPGGSASLATPRPRLHGRRAHVVLAGLALVALVAPPTVAVWRLTLVLSLPAVRPPAAFASPPAGDRGRGPRPGGPAHRVSGSQTPDEGPAEVAESPHESALSDRSPAAASPIETPPADPVPGARDLPQAEATVPMGEPLPVPAPPPAPSVPSPRP